MTANKQQSVASKVASVVSIPGYEIKDLLGRGGMAMVYLAVQKSIGREVALKVLSPDHADDSFSERFLREARIASQLSHPNIITVFDAGIHNDIHYMSMEYIKGKSFNEARDLLNRKQKVTVIKQIAQALDFASKSGFLHRDIKPENILLHQDGRAILTDFGIARANDVSKGLTETGKVLGTPYFMSPEQTKGLQIDHRTDIYSLGVVLFQALAGYVPYDGPSLVSICIKHLSDPIPQLPKGLEIFQPIINICMSKKPEHRYQHASELYNALDKISDKEIDEIDAKAKAFNKAGKNHSAETVIETSEPPTKKNKPVVKRSPANTPVRKKQKQSVSKQSQNSHNYVKPEKLGNITETEDFKNLNRRKNRILFLLLILMIALGYYQKSDILVFWNTQAKPVAQKYLPADIYTKIFNDQKEKIIPLKKKIVKPTLTIREIENNKISKLKESINKIPSNALILSNIYEERLALEPEDQETLKSINELTAWYISRTYELIKNKDYNSAQKTIKTLLSLHPDVEHTNAFVSLQDHFSIEKQNEPHLQKSRVYFAVNALNTPKGANALEELKLVLKNDSENIEALSGMRKIVEHFKKQSQQQISEKQYFKALDSTNSGLQAIYNDSDLLTLQKEIKSAIHSKNDSNKLLSLAEKQLDKGHSISPTGLSAYDLYKKVLATDRNNSKAKNGLKRIHKKITKQANTYIKENKFQDARKILLTASSLFPQSNKIKLLNSTLQKEMDSVLPIVPKIKISTHPFNEISAASIQKIKVGALLYIGFEYKNFTQESTSLKVNIYNGLIQNASTLLNQKLIIQKSITISGNNGIHFFSIKLPTSGITNGNYAFELMFGNARLIKASLYGLH